jgi:hypothetical protein
MTDDLVERLQKQFSIDEIMRRPNFVATVYQSERDEAANRIKKLYEYIGAYEDQTNIMLNRIDELETMIEWMDNMDPRLVEEARDMVKKNKKS